MFRASLCLASAFAVLAAAIGAPAQPLAPRPGSGLPFPLLAQEGGGAPEPDGKDAPFIEVHRDPVTGEVSIQGKLGGNGTEPLPGPDGESGQGPDRYPVQGGNPFGNPCGPYNSGPAP